MAKRRNIALITAFPEAVHVKRVVSGLIEQCRKYDYNLAVFCPMSHLDSPRVNYSHGEMNIFNLINMEYIDGVVLDTTVLMNEYEGNALKKVCEKMKRESKVPVVSLDTAADDFPIITSRNDDILREMVRHCVKLHGKKKLCVVTGPEGNHVAEQRLKVILEEADVLGAEIAPEHIIYGDFWYSCGDKLARELADRNISMPEAIICTSDHMALGLIYRLDRLGIRVPEDVIVIGYEATAEAAASRISLSSFASNDANTAADAVDYIRRIIEPDAPIEPYDIEASRLFHPGMSCGCEPDFLYSAYSLYENMYFTTRNYNMDDMEENIDIGQLMESYALEQLTASETPEQCIADIHSLTWLIKPFRRHFLCLRKNWLDADNDITCGYPQQMRIVSALSTEDDSSYAGNDDELLFDTSLMIPQMHDENEEASVYYFSSVHFNEIMLGYSVLQRSFSDEHRISLVYRNWLRFVSNALEMIRSKAKLLTLSRRDEMTGALNRRGMYNAIEKMIDSASDDSTVFVAVIDMDGLKFINDNYGHSEGDFGIKLVSSAAASVTRSDEILVRAGGDEFYIIGIGEYDESECEKRSDEFNRLIKKLSSAYSKPYTVSASIGCAERKLNGSRKLDDIICKADEIMYRDKTNKKLQRKD